MTTEEWSFPVGFLGALLLYSALDRLSRMPVFWTWAERISWLVTIIGFPLALLVAVTQFSQLRHEQERTRLEIARMERRPEIRVGFVSIVNPSELFQRIRIYPMWFDRQKTLSTYCDLMVRVYNDGNRTAKNLVNTFRLPPRVWIASAPGYNTLQNASSTWITEPQTIVTQHSAMNPGIQLDYPFVVSVARGLGSFGIPFSIAMEDERAVSGELIVEIDQTGDLRD